jgi:hypothetical protein
MRQNLARASAAQQDRNGMGPVYKYLLDRERYFQRRFGLVGTMRRPRHLLDALEAGSVVTVPFWKVPFEYRPPDCGSALVVEPSM